MGFGIFYMMVNIGGFLGPIVAGIVRGWDWQYVFYCSAGWILLMGVFALFVYKEPPRDDESESKRALSEVFKGMIGVVGNGRFFLLIVGLLFLLVMGSKWLEPQVYLPAAFGWLVFNFVWDFATRGLARSPNVTRLWLLEPMKVGEPRQGNSLDRCPRPVVRSGGQRWLYRYCRTARRSRCRSLCSSWTGPLRGSLSGR